MTDLRPSRARKALIAAVTAALDQPEGEVPSITDLCSAAGVSRPTFYQHFGDVASLIDAAAFGRLEDLFGTVMPIPADAPWERGAPVEISALMRGLWDQRTFYRRVLTGPSSQSFHQGVVEYLAQRLLTSSPLAATLHENRGDDGARLAATFLAAGTTWLLTRWLLDSSPSASLEDISEQIAALLLTAARPASTATPTD